MSPKRLWRRLLNWLHWRQLSEKDKKLFKAMGIDPKSLREKGEL